MKEAIIIGITSIISAIISGIITHYATKESNKSKLELVKNEAEVKYKELENALILKDKDIETLRVQHELELKSKEADVINQETGKLFQDLLRDPEGTTKRMKKVTQQTNLLNAGKLQGHKKKSGR